MYIYFWVLYFYFFTFDICFHLLMKKSIIFSHVFLNMPVFLFLSETLQFSTCLFKTPIVYEPA